MPNTYTGGFEFANPQYNVRPLGTKNEYIEIPVKGIKSTVVDYSLNGLAFINENIGKDNLEEGDSFTNFKGDSYIEESTDEVWNYSEAAQQQEADNVRILLHSAPHNEILYSQNYRYQQVTQQQSYIE